MNAATTILLVLILCAAVFFFIDEIRGAPVTTLDVNALVRYGFPASPEIELLIKERASLCSHQSWLKQRLQQRNPNGLHIVKLAGAAS